MLRRAVCPRCAKECAVRVPRGGDGSVDVFPRHMPGASRKTNLDASGSYCIGSRQEVPPESYLEER